MSLDAVRSSIDDFAHCAATTPEADLRAAAIQTLNALHHEVVRVQENANGYPANTISAAVWMDGAALGLMAENLAVLLNQRSLTDLEENAQALRCMAVLAVQSHYHHIVGPAMLGRAECNERLGNNHLAGQIYQAVIADFTWIVEEYAASDDAPNPDDRYSIECLSRAIDGVLRCQSDGVDAAAMESLRRKCDSVLTRPSSD